MKHKLFVHAALVTLMIVGAAWAQQPTGRNQERRQGGQAQPPTGQSQQQTGQTGEMGQRGQQPGMTQAQTGQAQAPPGAWYKSHDLIGKTVRDSNGEDVGRIENLVLVPESGKILFAIMSGDRIEKRNEHIALPWPALRFEAGARDVALNLSRDKLHGAQVASFNKDQWPNMSDKTFVQNVYQHFGFTPPMEEQAQLVGQREGGGAPAQAASYGSWVKVADLRDKDVKDASGAELGKLNNLVIELQSGYVLFAVVPGRELDKRDEVVAVPWPAVKIEGSGDKIHFVLNMAKDRLLTAPSFNEDNWPNITAPEFVNRTFAFYNVTPPTERGTRQVGYPEEEHKHREQQPQQPQQPGGEDRP